jgi:hypothetical protein
MNSAMTTAVLTFFMACPLSVIARGACFPYG